MVEDMASEQDQPPPFTEGRELERITLGGDEFLDAVIGAVASDDADKRAWARAVVEHEDTVADFVASVRRALWAVRERRGLSIEAAAEQVGVSASTLARLETGATAKTDLKLVARVALMLGVVPRLDFDVHGSAATIAVAALDEAPSRPDADHRPAAGIVPPDPFALDLRIRKLEERIAAIEPAKAKNGD